MLNILRTVFHKVGMILFEYFGNLSAKMDTYTTYPSRTNIQTRPWECTKMTQNTPNSSRNKTSTVPFLAFAREELQTVTEYLAKYCVIIKVHI